MALDVNFARRLLQLFQRYQAEPATVPHTNCLTIKVGFQETVDCVEAAKSFGQLADLVATFQEQLSNAGLKAGQVVVIIGSNSVQFLCISLAIWCLDAVLVPLNPSYKPGEFRTYFQQANSKLVLVDSSLVNKFDFNDVNCSVQVFDEHKVRRLKECQVIDDESTTRQASSELAETAVMFLSSGTTGLPKLIKVGHKALSAHLDIVASVRLSQVLPRISARNVCLSILPYFHAGGLVTALIMLAQGVRLIIWSRFEQDKFLDIIPRYNVTILSIVPAILDGMAKLKSVSEAVKQCLRLIFVGGDRLMPENVARMQDLLSSKQHILPLYGTTETGVLVFMRPILPQLPLDSCGLALPGVQVKRSENGELLLKTRTIMQGYSSHNLSDTVDSDGWLKTGDSIEILDAAFVQITGRLKDTVKVKGWQVSLCELERSIQSRFSEIRQVVVIEHNSKLYAMVQLRPNTSLDSHSVTDHIKDNFISYKHLSGVNLVDNIPTTASGKVSRWQSYELFVNSLIAKSE